MPKRVGLEKCIHCNSFNTIRFGFKHNKFECLQRWKCSFCGKIFTKKQLKQKSYSSKVIVRALSFYNSGFSLKATSEKINKLFSLSLKPQTVHFWVKEYRNVCSFARVRKKALRVFPGKKMVFKAFAAFSAV